MANVSNTTSTTTTSSIDAIKNSVEEKTSELISLMKNDKADNAEDLKAVISLIDKNVDVADKNAEDIKAVISLIVRDADNIKAVNSNVHANAKEIVMLRRNNATREMELNLLKLVMMAVVAYMLWWIGHA